MSYGYIIRATVLSFLEVEVLLPGYICDFVLPRAALASTILDLAKKSQLAMVFAGFYRTGIYLNLMPSCAVVSGAAQGVCPLFVRSRGLQGANLPANNDKATVPEMLSRCQPARTSLIRHTDASPDKVVQGRGADN